MIGQFTALLAKDNVNIDDMTNKSRGSYAYTMIDVDNDVAEDVVKGLEMIEAVIDSCKKKSALVLRFKLWYFLNVPSKRQTLDLRDNAVHFVTV